MSKGLRPPQPDTLGGNVYGMPSPGEGVKLGLHAVGQQVNPDQRTLAATPEVRAAVREHVAAGFPGHGYKFAPAIGRILADSATGIALPPEEFRLASHAKTC